MCRLPESLRIRIEKMPTFPASKEHRLYNRSGQSWTVHNFCAAPHSSISTRIDNSQRYSSRWYCKLNP